MKTLTQYQCEFCQTIYNTQEKAEHCEATHSRVQQIVPKYNNNNSAMPDRFYVRKDDDGEDGKYCWYYYDYRGSVAVNFLELAEELEAKYNPKEGDENAEGV